MTIKEKIIRTLHEASFGLQQLKDDFFIIGSAALILSDISIENTQDIDIITSKKDAELLKKIWASYKLNMIPKKSDKFHSDLSRYKFELLDIEIAGALQVYENGKWIPLVINDYKTYPIENLLIKIPTLIEQKNILSLFSREKDLQKIKLIDKQIYNRTC